MIPPVGKSGPLIPACTSTSLPSTFSRTSCMSSASEMLGLSMVRMIESRTSTGLFGAMLVAIPTAMPTAPLIIRFGNLPGSTVGSTRESS